MEKPLSLSLHYSANLRGDLAMLPQLFTFIQRLKANTAPGSLLLDLGNACDEAVWHCRQTAGRSMLIALDGMGYHAANVEGALEAQVRKQVEELVSMALVDRDNDWRYRAAGFGESSNASNVDNDSSEDSQDSQDIEISLRARPSAMPVRLQIRLAPAERTRIDGNTLSLQTVRAGQVGAARVAFDELRHAPRLIDSAIHNLPPQTPPNPSIAGVIEFVASEARLFHKKQSQPTS